MRADYLIIGQGISGTFLSWYLEKEGASCIVIDENKSNTASKVAAGLINPVTGRRLVKSWMIDDLMPFAMQAYREIGAELQGDCIREASLLQFFNAPDLQDAFNKKLMEDPEFLAPANGEDWRPYFNYPFGWGVIHPCYIADVAALTAVYGARLAERAQLIHEKFESAHLVHETNQVRYKHIHAKKIIFCDGESGLNNPWFNRLPYSLNKGEALTLQIPGLSTAHIYKLRHTLIPVDQERSVFWFGSNYEWTYDNDQPTEQFRLQAEAELKRFLKLPYTVINHKAAIRPANIERRPFVGLHPQFPGIGILNGMGTKGCSLAPYFAHQFARHLVRGERLLPAADIGRFKKTLVN